MRRPGGRGRPARRIADDHVDSRGIPTTAVSLTRRDGPDAVRNSSNSEKNDPRHRAMATSLMDTMGRRARTTSIFSGNSKTAHRFALCSRTLSSFSKSLAYLSSSLNASSDPHSSRKHLSARKSSSCVERHNHETAAARSQAAQTP